MLEISGIIFAFISMLFFGIGDSLFEIPARKFKEKIILFYQFFFMALFSIILLVIEREREIAKFR